MKFKFLLLSTFIGLIFSTSHSQTFTYQNTLTPTELVEDVLVGTGVVASNITYNGNAANALTAQPGAQSYTATGFAYPGGVYLETGNTPTISDPDLSAIALGSPTNGSILEFDFVATGDSLVFNYVFASVEYQGFTCSGFNDAFGFFLSGPGIAGPYSNGAVNLALVPGGNIPVTINTVNSGTPSAGNPAPCAALDPNWQANSIYFTTSYGNFSGEGFTGSTVDMVALSGLQCGATYHIKLAICNVLDTGLDSGVFLKANSFSSNAVTIQAEASVLSGSFTDTILAEGCSSTDLIFIRPEAAIDSVQTFTITYSGTADQSLDFTNLNGSVTFPIGVDSLIFTITPIDDGITEPMEWIQILGYTVSVCGDTLYDSITLYIVDQYDLTFDMPDTLTTGCGSNNLPVFITNFAGSIPSYSFSWDFGGTTNPVLIPSNGSLADTTMHYVTVTDGCNNDFVDSIAIVIDATPPVLTLVPDDTLYIKCMPGTATPSVVTSGGFGPFNYSWSTGGTDTSFTFSDNGVNGEQIPYTVTVTDGCTNTATVAGVIIVDQSLIVDDMTSIASNFCDPTGSATGTVAGETGNVNYAWTGPGTSGTGTANTSTWNNIASGWYYLTVTDNVCSANDSVFVDALDLPVALMTATPSSGLAPQAVVFTNNSLNGVTYYWDFGNGQTQVTNDLNSVSTTYLTEGTYTVELIASQGPGCENVTYLTITISILYPPVWEIPNVFSPNADLSNDLWTVETENVEKIDLTIVNRWGNVMHQSVAPTAVWNGESKGGNEAADGVYFYNMIVYGTDGSETPLHGFIHLTGRK